MAGCLHPSRYEYLGPNIYIPDSNSSNHIAVAFGFDDENSFWLLMSTVNVEPHIYRAVFSGLYLKKKKEVVLFHELHRLSATPV